jgi:outer membrane lipoprotein-sorting protein
MVMTHFFLNEKRNICRVKKFSIIWFVLMLLWVQTNAQQTEADKLIDKISKRYKQFKTIKADFNYQIKTQGSNTPQEKQKGNILIKGNKFRLEVANQIIICDNKTLWTYSTEVNEVQISNYDPNQNGIRLDDIFTMYNKGFLSKISGTKKEGNKELVFMELTPKDKKKNFFKIKLTVDKTNQQILSSEVYDKNGTIHTYTVLNQVPNLVLEDNQFVFDTKKYKGLEVIDLR